MSENKTTDFTRMPAESRLARYTVWNILGMSLPMVVALFAIPRLAHGLGEERFGGLLLIWMLVGYFSIFDLGLGRALTKMTAVCRRCLNFVAVSAPIIWAPGLRARIGSPLSGEPIAPAVSWSRNIS